MTVLPPSGAARVLHLEDGVVVFDPVSWRCVVVAPQALQVLHFLRDRIATGCRDRELLLQALHQEIDEDDGSAAADTHLAHWVELARNLYA